METVDVWLKGRVLPGYDPAAAAAAFARLARIEQALALEFVDSGLPRLVKRGVSRERGEALVARFAELGVAAGLKRTEAAGDLDNPLRLERDDERAGESKHAENAARYRKRPVERTAPAESRVPHIRRATGMWRESPARVPASHGFWWFVQACGLLFAQPFTWMKAMIAPALAQRSGFLSLLFAGGIVVMAHRQFEGEDVAAGEVFSGFRQNFGQLAMVAVYGGIYSLIVFGLAWMFSGGDLRTLFEGGEWSRTGLIALGFCVVGSAPLVAGSFFAPILVVLAGEDALDALWKGFVAWLVNWPAMLVNALVMAIACGVVMALGICLAFLLAPVSASSEAAIFLIWLVLFGVVGLPLFSVFSLMSYTAGRDIFYDAQ